MRCRALVAGLARPLATDAQRALFWQRHARNGVLLTEVVVAIVVGYLLVTPTPAHRDPVLLGMVVLVAATSPVLLLLPVARISHGSGGLWLFYGWSVADTVIIAVVAVRDGGAASPLYSLLFLTLGFMAMAYPAAAVALIGAGMTLTYLLVVCGGAPDLSALFIAMTMATFTAICTVTAQLQRRAYDEQQLLLRTQETLAATDPLTGSLNRRAFLRRLDRFCRAPHPNALLVCVVDLDGFKTVNDSEGHAAGDRILVDVARVLSSTVRETDTVARLGGDEFALIASLRTPTDAGLVADRIRQAVVAAGAARGVTGSVGFTLVQPDDDAHAVLVRADHAMYAAKSTGGNRTSPATVR